MILTLLAKVIVFYLQMAIGKVGVLNYERFIRINSRTRWRLVLSLFNTGFDKLPEENIDERDLRSKGRRSGLKA